MSNKLKLRKHMATVLAKLSADNKLQQSQQVFEKVIAHPAYKRAQNVSIYLSTNQEINTIQLLKHALEVDKKHCFIPYIPKQTSVTDRGDHGQPRGAMPRMLMVELSSMRQYNELPVNSYNIKEPDVFKVTNGMRGINLEDDLHLIIVPGVAFARDGRRLGHGKGYYDEYLWFFARNLPTNKLPFTLGLAFQEQIVEDPLAVSGQDYELDEVLTA